MIQATGEKIKVEEKKRSSGSCCELCDAGRIPGVFLIQSKTHIIPATATLTRHNLDY
jgi:hypothetical protein